MTGTSVLDTRRRVERAIRSVLPHLGPADIVGSRDLAGLGADSVDRVEIVGMLIADFGVAEPMSVFSELCDVDALVDFIHERAGGT